MKDAAVAALIVLPVLAMGLVLALYEARRTEVAAPPAGGAAALPLPFLPPARPGPGTYETAAGRLSVRVSDVWDGQTVTAESVHIGLESDVDRQFSSLRMDVDLSAMTASTPTPWPAETSFALLDAPDDGHARFVADRLGCYATPVPGVSRLCCEGVLTLHGRARRERLDLLVSAERKDRVRIQADLRVDVREFDLPRSRRFGFLPMDPMVSIRLDATLARASRRE